MLIDVRTEEDFKADPRLIPTARRHDFLNSVSWAKQYAGQSVIVYCQQGLKHSQGTAAWLRHEGINAQTLEGGHEAWCKDCQPLVPTDKLPQRDDAGRSLWVTRARPKVIRIACPWLIRRFIDPQAVFLFVAASEVQAVADRFNATPFDIDNVFWSDRDNKCTFDVMIEELGLDTDVLLRLALIVRGADTGRLDLTPQSAG
ncbi:MAG: chromate resistance protein ChrB domain-containing protein, partial [Burkholderiales bacterium]